MPTTATATMEYVCAKAQRTRHAILIDPADQTPDMAKRCLAAVAAGSSMVLVGGSSDTDMVNVHDTVVAIQEALELVTWAATQDAGAEEDPSKVPVVLFPQGLVTLSPAADAITFMMLMNSTNPRFLIEEQVSGSAVHSKGWNRSDTDGVPHLCTRWEGGRGRRG